VAEAGPKSFWGSLFGKGKNVVGYIIGKLSNDGKSGEIISLAVDAGWRKMGIGKRLAQSLINHFQKKGAREVLVHVRTNNTAGIGFHKNLGFEVVETLREYYRNGDDAYLMRKEI
jgi:ribosomal-protein-alanine N-acetyltransferase